jgi:hypothetical protein
MGLHISNQWSSQLMDVLGDCTIAGLERSAKFSHRSLNDDRFIIGPHHKSFTVDRLQGILRGLRFPESHLSEAVGGFEKSNQCGLGFERNNGVSSYRFYLEFFDQYVPDPTLNRGVLHIGYKWLCDDPAKMIVTRYSYAPSFDGNNPERVIRDALIAMNGQFVDAVISAALKSTADIPPGNRIMTCASEATGCRRSFDVNVYKSKKKLDFIGPELEQIVRFFQIEQKILDTFLAESGYATIGHIAAGLNAVHDPFFTVYFDDYSDFAKQRKRNL